MTQTNDQTATEAQVEPKSGHILTILTILIDLTRPAFADRRLGARVNIAQTLNAFLRASIQGAESSIVETGEEGEALGVMVITTDVTGEGKQAFDKTVAAVRELNKIDEDAA